MLQKIVDNVLIDVDHVIAVFVDSPNEFQHRVVALFNDGQRQVICEEFTSDIFLHISKLFTSLRYLVEGVDLVCRTDLVELVKYDPYRESLLVKIKSYVIKLEFVDNLKL